jgi:predicted nucleic acid-binding protein
MIVLDASVWVAVSLPHDALHRESLEWAEEWMKSGRTIVVPSLFPVELGAALVRRLNVEADATRLVDDMMDDPFFTIVPMESIRAQRAARLAIMLQLRGADAVYVELAESMNVPLVTWDRQQQTRSTARIRSLTPAELRAVDL